LAIGYRPSPQLGALALAWLVPFLAAANIALTLRFNPAGWMIVEMTPAGDALFGFVVFAGFICSANLRSGWSPWLRGLTIAGLVVSAILSLLSPLRLVLLIASAVTLLDSGVSTLRSKKALALVSLLIAAIASAGMWRAGFSENAVVPGPGNGFDFVIHDGDAGATGGGTTGYARMRLAGMAQVQVRLFYGELGARPVVRWIDERSLSIDGTEVDVWDGPCIGLDY
jgi:hypothetical protein